MPLHLCNPSCYQTISNTSNYPCHHFQIRFLAADVICFQEVDKWYYEEIFKDELANLGYDIIFAMKEKETLEGLVTAVRKEKFYVEASNTYSLNNLMYEEADCLGIDRSNNSLSHLEKDNVGIVTILRHLETGNKLFVCMSSCFNSFEIFSTWAPT